MRVYFVRHGESLSNTGPHDGRDAGDELTDRGWEQAQSIGSRLANEELTHLYVSPMQRAQETAAAILESVDVPVTHLDYIHEIIRAESTYNRDPKTTDLGEVLHTYWHQMADASPDERTEQAESFSDIRDRVQRLLDRLLEDAPESAVVVTHGGFLRVLLGMTIRGTSFGPSDIPDFMKVGTINTGISEFEHNDEHGWRLITWMDQSHL